MSSNIEEVISNATSTGKTKWLFAAKWVLILIFVFFGVVAHFFIKQDPQGLLEITALLSLAALAWVHGSERYGIKNMVIWFLITWVVSNFFEALSIKTGFPFGHYHYQEVPGPRIIDVPIFVMPLYFGMAYLSWTLSQVITRQYRGRIQGVQKFILPFTATIVMTMYDVVLDPINSTVKSLWVWHNGGEYFGVPIVNFFGWLLCVYVFMQLFTLCIAGRDVGSGASGYIVNRKIYWIEAVILQFFMGVRFITLALNAPAHVEIYRSMALVDFFTVIFVAFLGFLTVKASKELT